MNAYPYRSKNPMPKDAHDIYIEVDTEVEANYIEDINEHMRTAYWKIRALEDYIETKML